LAVASYHSWSIRRQTGGATRSRAATLYKPRFLTKLRAENRFEAPAAASAKGGRMEPKTGSPNPPTAAADEAAVVELVDRVDALGTELTAARAELERLRRERSEMQDDLSTARGWVRVLAAEVEELNRRLAGR
jgi:hypothetical protein